MCEPKQVTDWQAHKRGQGGQEDAPFARHVPPGVSEGKAGEAASTLCRPGLTHTRSGAHERISSLEAEKAHPDISCFLHVSLFVAAICCPFLLPVARAEWGSAGNEMVYGRRSGPRLKQIQSWPMWKLRYKAKERVSTLLHAADKYRSGLALRF